jgi:hypothetical protein
MWVVECFQRIVEGWFRTLRNTSSSGAVWEPEGGVLTDNFKSRSGRQCDGVTRMLPALAAWAFQPENPSEWTTEDGQTIRPRPLIRDALVNGTDPAHPDFWEYGFADRQNQRQVESSVVAWTLWLSRDWLLPTLNSREIAHIQAWLASCTRYGGFQNNWTMFIAVNHAARLALADAGFEGDEEAIRHNLIVGDEADVGDGWLWDIKGRGLDYYNFWVNGSHHGYLRAMLPGFEDARLDRIMARFEKRAGDLPFLIGSRGENVLFGRSLPYRWGWLTGLMVLHFLGRSPVAPGLSRAMLGRNLEWWLAVGSLNEKGVLRERLTAAGSGGARDSYINCGHPYWGMQAFLCLALPSSHPFWAEDLQPFPVERGDFVEVRPGVGWIFQGIGRTGEVRLFNTRNLSHGQKVGGRSVLYEKLVYSSGFPCNVPSAGTHWDNQFGLRLADGSHVSPKEISRVEIEDGRRILLSWLFEGEGFSARVETSLVVEGESYATRHAIRVQGAVPEGSTWVEGGFPIFLNKGEKAVWEEEEGRWTARFGKRRIWTERKEGWSDGVEVCDSAVLPESPNLLYAGSLHFVLVAPVGKTPLVLAARHGASLF